MESITHKGSVDDIRCALGHINPKSSLEQKKCIVYLEASYHVECSQTFPRQTVLKMIDTKLRKLNKMSF